MRKLIIGLCTVFGLCLFIGIPSLACTSYYVGSDLTADGSTLYGRNEDYGGNWDKVFKVIDPYEVPEDGMWVDGSGATDIVAPFKEGLTETYRYTVCRDAEDCDDGYMGEVGVNEKGVSMSATTTAITRQKSGPKEADPFTGNGGLCEEIYTDYVLCQADSARDGVEILAAALDVYGVDYAADGIFIADENEVWYMETVSGHQYCAIKMPSDKAAIIPTRLMIGDVDVDDTENVIASAGLVSLAEENDFLVEAQEEDPDVYDINVKLTYDNSGYGSDYSKIRGGQYKLSGIDNTDYNTEDYVDMFFDIPDGNVTVEQVYEAAGNQCEDWDGYGEDFDDIRSQRSPSYMGTNSTDESHIIQIFHDDTLPTELKTVEWLSMKNAAYSPMVPFYGALITDTPDSYKVEEYHSMRDTANHSDESMFWFCYDIDTYARSASTMIQKSIKNYFRGYVSQLEADQPAAADELLAIYNSQGLEAAQEAATDLGCYIGTETFNIVKSVYQELTTEAPLNFTTSYDDVNYGEFLASSEDVTEDTTEDTSESKVTVGKVKLKKVKNIKGKKIKLRIKPVKGADGYEVAYSTNVNFRKAKTKTVKMSSDKKIKKIKKNLKKGKTYYVKVRAYKKSGSTKVYGKWSNIKKAKIKK